MSSQVHLLVTACILALVLVASAGCQSRSAEEVVVYAALDREFSEPLLEKFQAQTKALKTF